jgi:phage-related minor tail protein
MSDTVDILGLEVEGLEEALGGASDMAAAFSRELSLVRGTLGETVTDLGNLERGFSGGLRRAFDGLVLDGMKLSDALRGVARSMVDTVYAAAVNPVTNHFGGLLSDGVNALVAGIMPGGGVSGKVTPFAKGGVLSGPVAFPMRGGLGLMGEAGPEAIMPLTRGADGRLGVRAQGGGSVHVTMNVTTPDVAGFQRSQGQIAAQMGRALGRGARNR